MNFSYLKYLIKENWIPTAIVAGCLLVSAVKADEGWTDVVTPTLLPVMFICETAEAAVEFVQSPSVEDLPAQCVYGGPVPVTVEAYSTETYKDPVHGVSAIIARVNMGGVSGYSAFPVEAVEFLRLRDQAF